MQVIKVLWLKYFFCCAVLKNPARILHMVTTKYYKVLHTYPKIPVFSAGGGRSGGGVV